MHRQTVGATPKDPVGNDRTAPTRKPLLPEEYSESAGRSLYLILGLVLIGLAIFVSAGVLQLRNL